MPLKNSHSSTKPTAAALKSSGGGGVACRFIDEPSVPTSYPNFLCFVDSARREDGHGALVSVSFFGFWGFALLFNLQASRSLGFCFGFGVLVVF